jgi:hypothetical protein
MIHLKLMDKIFVCFINVYDVDFALNNLVVLVLSQELRPVDSHNLLVELANRVENSTLIGITLFY